jgi:predicted secreted protein
MPTAGYLWELVVSGEIAEVLKLLGSDLKPDTSRVGAPAVQLFHFRAIRPGKVNVHFRYARPWEGVVKEERLVSVQVE